MSKRLLIEVIEVSPENREQLEAIAGVKVVLEMSEMNMYSVDITNSNIRSSIKRLDFVKDTQYCATVMKAT